VLFSSQKSWQLWSTPNKFKFRPLNNTYYNVSRRSFKLAKEMTIKKLVETFLLVKCLLQFSEWKELTKLLTFDINTSILQF